MRTSLITTVKTSTSTGPNAYLSHRSRQNEHPAGVSRGSGGGPPAEAHGGRARCVHILSVYAPCRCCHSPRRCRAAGFLLMCRNKSQHFGRLQGRLSRRGRGGRRQLGGQQGDGGRTEEGQRVRQAGPRAPAMG